MWKWAPSTRHLWEGVSKESFFRRLTLLQRPLERRLDQFPLPLPSERSLELVGGPSMSSLGVLSGRGAFLERSSLTLVMQFLAAVQTTLLQIWCLRTVTVVMSLCCLWIVQVRCVQLRQGSLSRQIGPILYRLMTVTLL